MFLRLANLKARQQLQSLDIDGLQPLQQLCRDILTQQRTTTSYSAVDSDSSHHQTNSGHQHIMTTGQHFVTLQQQQQEITKQPQQQQLESASHSTQGTAYSTHPSPSSSASECLHMDRPSSACGSTKSAKRKAAEALLAARYTSSSTSIKTAGSVAVVSSPVVHSNNARFSWAAAATNALKTPDQVHSKRQRSTLSAAINRLQDSDGSVSAAAGAAPAVPPVFRPKQQHLERLQSILVRLQDQHQQHGLKQQQQQQASEVHLQQVQQQLQQQQPGHDASAAMPPQQQPQHAPVLQLQPLQPPLQQCVQVPACSNDCKHSSEQGWCHTQVKLPHVDWSRVLDADLNKTPSFKIATGYERIQLPEGLQVLIVENINHLPNALQQLRASMHDPYVAIDLEWRPEFGRRFTPVALMQLASSKMAVLVRTCRMSYLLPPALKAFLKDPKVQLVGFSWSSSDEPKMQSTFGVGFKDFGRFMDLQLVARGLGYNGFGLARLTKRVLGLNMPKSKSITMSNWEAATISRNQVKYAALDVLVAGQVFRALRLWHQSPSLCEVCHYNLGSTGDTPSLYSCSCGKAYKDLRAYVQHCERSDHKPQYAECSGCGCARPLPWPGQGDIVGAGEYVSTSSKPSSSDGEVEAQVQ